MSVSLPYIQIFCRMALLLVFAISCVSKLRQFSAFQLSIIKFNLLPQRLSLAAALIFTAGEGAVVVLLAIGGFFVLPGFVLALCLLALFTFALSSVLARHIKAACLCFGSVDKDASAIDLWRNAGLLLCTGIGILITVIDATGANRLALVSYILLLLMAATFVVVWIQLGDVVQVFRQVHTD